MVKGIAVLVRVTCAAVMATMMAVAPVWAAEAIDSATYTTTHFDNAPESLIRVESWKKHGDGALLLTSIANPCGRSPGSTYKLLVKNAGESTFRRGDLLITGMAHTQRETFWAVRHVHASELQQLGGCPRTK